MTEIGRRAILLATAGAFAAAAFSGPETAQAKGPDNSALPAAFQRNDIIVFQGDSITDGGRQREGLDYNHIMGQDYCYIIAGEILSQFPAVNLTFLNRGIGGNTVNDLTGRWQADTLDLKPSLVSILIGVNDCSFAFGKIDPLQASENYQSAYDALVQQTITALPGVRIVIAQPFALPVGSRQVNFDAYQAMLGLFQKASEDIATKYKLPYVRYADMFNDACKRASPDHWSWDGIHPTYAGHFLMHRLWLDTVQKFYT
jgi:lysophospholipase L1-like esterase